MKKEETPEINWQERAEAAERLAEYLNSQIEELTWSLEVANDRWVKQVNENTALEVQLRRANKMGVTPHGN